MNKAVTNSPIKYLLKLFFFRSDFYYSMLLLAFKKKGSFDNS